MKSFYLKSKKATKLTKIVQISDSHMIVVDETDKENYIKQKDRKLFFERESLARTGEVHYAEEKLSEAVEYARQADLTIFTGDIIEFPTAPNVNKMVEYFSKLDDYLYTFGNHDYMDYTLKKSALSQYEKNVHLFKDVIKNDLEFAVKEVNGISVVAMDNSRFQFSLSQYERLKKTFDEGREIVLSMHIPLYHPTLDFIGQKKVNAVADTCGMAYGLGLKNSATPITKAVIDLIKENHEQVLAILVGHNHFDAVVPYYENVVEYVCAPTYLNDFYEFIIEPKKD